MKRFSMRFCIYGGLLAWALSGATVMPVRGRIVELIADKDNIFKIPGQKKPIIYAKAGEPLHLRILCHRGGEWARDGAAHSLEIKKLRDHGWDVRLMEGLQEFDVAAASVPGEYLIECTVKCGHGHEDMNMKLVVTK